MTDSPSDYMDNLTKETIRLAMPRLTPAEKTAGSFFLANTQSMDFSCRQIAQRLYISEAALSRFSKKCGYRGYREFIYSYERDLTMEIAAHSDRSDKSIQVIARKVEASYQGLLHDSFRHLSEDMILRVAKLLNNARRVKVLGLGSSGFAAREFQLRFMRTGMEIEAITDSQVMQMSAAIADAQTLLIGITLSGRTRVVLDSLSLAKGNGAGTILFTSGKRTAPFRSFCDELVPLSSLKNLETGMRISPQFPILVVFDVLYSYYCANDSSKKADKLRATLSVITEEREDYV